MVRYFIENDFKKLLGETVNSKPLDVTSRILNIACEFERVPVWFPKNIARDNVYGLEINRELIAKDKNIKYCDVDRERFPFADNTFDLAISVFGVEHFKTDNVFREARRALKPKGQLIFLAPNVLYPAFLLNRLLGNSFARFFYRKIMRSDYKPHTAYYRFNRLGTIRRAAREAGFTNADLIFFGPSNILLYLRNHPVLQKLALMFERLLTNPLFFSFKPYIIAILEK